MELKEPNILNEPKENWGGAWTEKKLDAFTKYVRSYLTILNKNKHWETIYFDGFAGCGTRKKKENTELYLQLLSEEEEHIYKGAAERVLSIENLSFDYYYFIDKNEKAITKLKNKLNSKFPNIKLICKNDDVNEQLKLLSEALKTNKYAALIFLDPFGMQIDWNSIANLKGTRSDIWILVPTGVIINRLLDKKGELKNSAKLESFFGLSKDEIKDYFYTQETTNTLFGEEEIVTKVSEPIEKIAKLYVKRLGTIWKFVTKSPLVLYNSKGTPIFHFVFASNYEVAVKIAKQIIDKT